MRRALFVLLVLGCDTRDLASHDYGPPTPRPPGQSHETTSDDCDRMGGEWIPNAWVAVGGTCQVDPQPPRPMIQIGARDAGADGGDAHD